MGKIQSGRFVREFEVSKSAQYKLRETDALKMNACINFTLQYTHTLILRNLLQGSMYNKEIKETMKKLNNHDTALKFLLSISDISLL